ncbi:MAG: hypothetical protein HY304_09035 [candidate division Zixibacteria bacterium]|nr:hypothetical protein [candidate division Zixibacteria bacterium]
MPSIPASPNLTTRPDASRRVRDHGDPVSSGDPEIVALGRGRRDATTIEWAEPAGTNPGSLRIGIEYAGRNLVLAGVRTSRSGRRLACLLDTEFDDTPNAGDISNRLLSIVGRQHPAVDVVISSPRGIVRSFLLPRVANKHRRQAALWEGQKLIPFPLNEGAAVFGMDFADAADRGWWVTLVAVPMDDAAPILAAIDHLGWGLRSLSLAGTQRLPEEDAAKDAPDQVRATAIWSPRRGSFCVYDHQQLKFHFDLGPLPPPPRSGANQSPQAATDTLRHWVGSLGAAVSDALDFDLNDRPNPNLIQLDIIGIPESAAPLLTEWRGRFESGVRVVDPTQGCTAGLPEGVSSWLSDNLSTVAPSFLAAVGGASVDLIPASMRARQGNVRRHLFARGGFLASLATVLVSSGLLWMHVRNEHRIFETVSAEFAQLQISPVYASFARMASLVEGRRMILAGLARSRPLWMPWARTVLASVPDGVALQSFDVQADTAGAFAPGAELSARLEGTLSPGGTPFALTYKAWLENLEALCGPGRVHLDSERAVDRDGRRGSAFSIALRPRMSTVTGENR